MKIGLMKTPTRGPAGLPRAPAFVDGKLQGQGTTPPAQKGSQKKGSQKKGSQKKGGQKKGSQKKGSQAKGKTPRRAGAADSAGPDAGAAARHRKGPAVARRAPA